MRLHLIRHGETRHNVEGRIQGDLLDDPLNENGRAQAQALRAHYVNERLRGLHVSAVYSSPMKRAYETAQAVTEALDLPEPVALDGLREISWGRHNGQRNEGPVRADMERVLRAWAQGDLTASTPGGETPGQAWERAIKDLAPVLERHARDDIVLVAHGRINKVVASGLLHGDLHHMEEYPQSNCGISILGGPDPWRLLVRHSAAHLAGLRALDERHS